MAVTRIRSHHLTASRWILFHHALFRPATRKRLMLAGTLCGAATAPLERSHVRLAEDVRIFVGRTALTLDVSADRGVDATGTASLLIALRNEVVVEHDIVVVLRNVAVQVEVFP